MSRIQKEGMQISDTRMHLTGTNCQGRNGPVTYPLTWWWWGEIMHDDHCKQQQLSLCRICTGKMAKTWSLIPCIHEMLKVGVLLPRGIATEVQGGVVALGNKL